MGGWAPGWAPDLGLDDIRANLAVNGPHVGTDGLKLVWAGPQQAMLVLGPPRSGKTSSLVVPNVLAAPGPVLVTSTKTGRLLATVASRSQLGRCWLLDPSGSIEPPPGANVLRWSPVVASHSWEEALVTAVMTASGRPEGNHGEGSHWTERAEALLAPLFHAAALAGADHPGTGHPGTGHGGARRAGTGFAGDGLAGPGLTGAGMRPVLTWVLRHDLQTPAALLAQTAGSSCVALDVLAGIAATEERATERFSTAAGVLSAYRSELALELAELPNSRPHFVPRPDGTRSMYARPPATRRSRPLWWSPSSNRCVLPPTKPPQTARRACR